MNHESNARFIITLAEKGKSFHPHIPKRRSDQVGLFRAICWEVKYGGREFFSVPLSAYRSRHEIITFENPGEQPMIFFPVFLPNFGVSPLARLRILAYFRPIIPPNDAHVRLLK